MKTATLQIKSLKAVNLFASTESTRYYLNGVLVTVAPRSVLYVATDGHRMLVHRDDLAEGEESNTLTGRWIIPSESIAAIKGGTGRFDSVPAVLSDLGDGRLSLEAPKGAVIVKPIDGTFPDFHRVLPRAAAAAETAHNQFNLKYAADFAKAAELLGYGGLAPHVHPTAAGFPLPVTFGAGRTTLGVLMPVRGSADPYAGAPDWLSLEPAGEAPAIAAE